MEKTTAGVLKYYINKWEIGQGKQNSWDIKFTKDYEKMRSYEELRNSHEKVREEMKSEMKQTMNFNVVGREEKKKDMLDFRSILEQQRTEGKKVGKKR